MFSALSTSISGMQQAMDRTHELAIGIANPTPERAPKIATQAERPVKPEDPIAPVSASPSVDPARQWIELKQTELAFKASATATDILLGVSQELMDALR